MWENLTPHDDELAHQNNSSDIDHCVDSLRSFIRALWYAIEETEVTGWVERSGAILFTPQWSQSLRDAREAAVSEDMLWHAVTSKEEMLMSQSPQTFD